MGEIAKKSRMILVIAAFAIMAVLMGKDAQSVADAAQTQETGEENSGAGCRILHLQDITWKADDTGGKLCTKVYDGSAQFLLYGYVTEDPSQRSERVLAEAASEQVCEEKPQRLKICAGSYDFGESCRLEVAEDTWLDESVLQARILRRPLYVCASSLQRVYAVRTKDPVTGGELSIEEEMAGTGLVHLAGGDGAAGKDSGLVEEDRDKEEFASCAFAVAAEDESGRAVEKFTVGSYKLTPVIPREKSRRGNYEYKTAPEGSGTLTVRAQGKLSASQFAEAVRLSMENIIKLPGEELALRATGARLSASLNTDISYIASQYHNVWLSLDRGAESRFAKGSLDLGDSPLPEGDAVLKVRLTLGGVSDETCAEYSMPVHIDGSAPKPRVDGEEVAALSDVQGNVRFERFVNHGGRCTVEITDEGCGIGTDTDERSPQRYVLWKLEENTRQEDIDEKAELEEGLERLGENAWKKLTLEEDGYWLALPDAAREGAGNYLLFIRTRDRLGNEETYLAGGVVADAAEPELELDFSNALTYTPGGIPSFAGDAEYCLKIRGDGALSGIKDVSVTVDKDGKCCSGTVSTVRPSEERVYVDSWNYAPAPAAGYTLTQLLEDSFLTVRGRVSCEDVRSNNTKLKITVRDRAGNETSYRQKLILDRTPPKISVSLENAQEGVKHSGVRYYREPKILLIRCDERNFLSDAAHLSFDVSCGEDVKKRISLEQLQKDYAEHIRLLSLTDSQAEQRTGESEDAGGQQPEEGKDAVRFTQERKIELRLEFFGEDLYRITPHLTDALGNASSGDELCFAVDCAAPEIDSMRYFTRTGGSFWQETKAVKAPVSGSVKLEITVHEHFFADEGNLRFDGSNTARLKLSQKHEEKDARKPGYYTEAAKSVGGERGWVNTGPDLYTLTLVLDRDAVYEMSLAYTDLAGRKMAAAKFPRVTVDTQEPAGSVSVGARSWKNLNRKAVCDTILRDAAQIRAAAQDHTSGIASISYCLYTPDESGGRAEYGPAGGPGTLPESAWKTVWRVSGKELHRELEKKLCTVRDDCSFIVFLRISDRAGNTAFRSSGGVIVDRTQPRLQIRIRAKKPRKGIYGGDVPFTVTVKDIAVNGSFSGIASASWEILSDGRRTQSGSFFQEKRAGRHRQKAEGLAAVLARQNNSNYVRIHVHAADQAGNEADVYQELKIDVTAPVIRVRFRRSAHEGRFYREARTAAVAITERNFDPDAVDWEISGTGGARPEISSWKQEEVPGKSGLTTHTAVLRFREDADYSFCLKVTDRAGNSAKYKKTEYFTIDRTKPVLRVSFDNNDVRSGRYYSRKRTAAIMVREHNFDPASLRARVTASRAGTALKAPAPASWRSDGDMHTCKIEFSADGDYSFTLDYTDKAGSKTAQYVQETFTIDRTDPEIRFFGVEEDSACRNEADPGASCTDDNLAPQSVKLTLKGAHHPAVMLRKGAKGFLDVRTITGGQSFQLKDYFPVKKEADDIYTLTVSAQDLAGRKTEAKRTFSVNRFGSTYTVEADSAAFLGRYYNRKAENLVICEINPDQITQTDVSAKLGVDGELRELIPGKDFRFEEESGSTGSWRKYIWTLDAGLFRREGSYTIVLNSVDAAGNHNDSSIRAADLQFVIDASAPSLVITGVQERGLYRAESRDVHFLVSDNAALERLEIYENGSKSPVKSFDAGKLASGEVSLEVGSSGRWQSLRAVLVDAAGNRREEEIRHFLITSNVWMQISHSAVLPALAAIAAAGILLILERRKRKKS